MTSIMSGIQQIGTIVETVREKLIEELTLYNKENLSVRQLLKFHLKLEPAEAESLA